MKPTLTTKLKNEIKKYIMSLDKKNAFDRLKIISLYQLLTESRKTTLKCDDITMIDDEMIVSKKFTQIQSALAKEDINSIMEIPKVQYQGGKFVPENKWIIPEEELLMWSKASLENDSPSAEGYARYRTLFLELFPNA